MCLEIHLAVADEHTFRAETDLLLESDLVLQQDLATGPDHPVPRQAVARMQRPNDLPRTSRVTGGLRHLTISRDIAARDALYRLLYTPEHNNGNSSVRRYTLLFTWLRSLTIGRDG
jgi:hypothetical protein